MICSIPVWVSFHLYFLLRTIPNVLELAFSVVLTTCMVYPGLPQFSVFHLSSKISEAQANCDDWLSHLVVMFVPDTYLL